MNTNSLTQKLETALPGAVLQTVPFGKAGQEKKCVWVELKSIQAVGAHLKKESFMDWLENLSVMEMDGALVFTYFIRSTRNANQIILRASVMPESASDWVTAPSVTSIWPMAGLAEQEVADLFGVRFEGRPEGKRVFLPEDWEGFPLRKGYRFPQSVDGIQHSRPAGRTE